MSRRDEWRKVLDAETERWSGKSCEQLLAELHEDLVYEVVAGSKRYQVEVELLESAKEYVQVCLAVDDGGLPWSIAPLTRTFIQQKDKSY